MSAALDLDALLELAPEDLDAEEARIDRELVARGGFAEFARLAWPIIEGAALQWNWHHQVLCDYLEQVTRREIHLLIISVPPGTSKSTFVSVLWPAWVWTIDPGHRWICATYDLEIARRDSRRHRKLVASAWYRARWPEAALAEAGGDDSATVGLWGTAAGGSRNSITTGSGATGKHAHTHIYDDPNDTRAAAQVSGAELEASVEWCDQTMFTRFCDPPNKARVCVMQRLAENDLAAHLAKQPGAVVLCLPMRFEPDHPQVCPDDPRTEPRELLHPERFPEETVQQIETVLGDYGAAAQLQQRPAPKGGGLFKTDRFQYWTKLPAGGTWALSIDCTFKKTTDGSFVVIQVWLQVGPNHYLIDQTRERMDFTATLAAILAMVVKYPRAHLKLVEDKANGSAVVDVMRDKLAGLKLVEPEGGKEARANAVQPLVESKNVFLPHPEDAEYPDGRKGAPWVKKDFLPEVTRFPKAGTDDQVDAMTQYLHHAAPGYAERLKAAMAVVFKKG